MRLARIFLLCVVGASLRSSVLRGVRPRAMAGAVLVSAGLFAAPLTRAAEAGPLGFDTRRLTRLKGAIEEEIGQRKLAGGVMYIQREGRTALLEAYGQMDIEQKKPMRTDAIFRVASMSKAVTTVAALVLYEEGRFMLNDPIGKYLPAFANPVVAIPPPPGSPPQLKYVTEPARGPITIRHLMTHTSGLTYGEGTTLAASDHERARLQGWYFADRDETIADVITRLAKLPLNGHPGESWQYGYSSDVLGRLIEVVSGQPLDRFMQERIFAPLKMTDTSFFLPPEKLARLATVYGISDGQLRRGDQGAYVDGPRKCFSGGAGLLTTAQDYGRFLQMLVQGGALGDVRLLSPITVALMHENHVGEKYATQTRAPGQGTHGFGLGFWVNDQPGHMGEAIAPGAFGWGSAYFPQYVVDPTNQLVFFFLTQLRPAGDSALNHRIKVLTYQALVK